MEAILFLEHAFIRDSTPLLVTTYGIKGLVKSGTILGAVASHWNPASTQVFQPELPSQGHVVQRVSNYTSSTDPVRAELGHGSKLRLTWKLNKDQELCRVSRLVRQGGSESSLVKQGMGVII